MCMFAKHNPFPVKRGKNARLAVQTWLCTGYWCREATSATTPHTHGLSPHTGSAHTRVSTVLSATRGSLSSIQQRRGVERRFLSSHTSVLLLTTSPCLLCCQGPTPTSSSSRLRQGGEDKPAVPTAQGTMLEKNIYLELEQGDTRLPPQTNQPSSQDTLCKI